MNSMAEFKSAQQEPTWQPHHPGSTSHDPLLASLLLFAKIHEQQVSQHTLTSGLPLIDNRLTPELFVRAAERAGLAAQVVKQPLAKIPSIAMPVVLLLKDKQA